MRSSVVTAGAGSALVAGTVSPGSSRSRALLVGLAAGLVGLSFVASGCGGTSHRDVAQLSATTTRNSSPSTGTPGSTAEDAALAFSRCMRSHGVANFPDPGPQGDFPPFHATVPKQAAAAANQACKHLPARGGSTGTPQQRRQKLAFALQVARCLRVHGYPDFPDPTDSGQRIPPGINTDSPRFQTTETTCEQQARKALGLP